MDRCDDCARPFVKDLQNRGPYRLICEACKQNRIVMVRSMMVERSCRRCGCTVLKSILVGRPVCDNCNRSVDRVRWKRNKHVRRARLAGAVTVRFNPNDILKRDRFRCQICGVKTRPELAPTSPTYPNVDHIVPLAKGGEHSPQNTQCVCRRCNSRKKDRLFPQQTSLIPLFPMREA